MPFAVVNSSKNITENTAKIYRGHLNAIAKNTPYNTVEDLVNHPVEIINYIKSSTADITDETKRRFKRRVKYCAIFWALHDSEFTKQPNNIYRKAFHDEDPVSLPDGRAWKKSYALRDD